MTAVRPRVEPFAYAAGAEPAEVPVVHPVNRLLDIKSESTPVPLGPDAGSRRSAAERRDEIQPMTADSSRLHVTVSRRFLEKLEAARAALSHAHPGADARRSSRPASTCSSSGTRGGRGKTERPRREPPRSKPEHVPAHVKREVWDRDGGRCQWRLESGGICGSTHRVELDHVVARGRGGPSTPENLRLLCRVHNDLAARLVYGDAWMDTFTHGKAAPAHGDAAEARGRR